ncbi:hypothetical protein KR655_21115, partial [Acinetobacter baumannii]|nr:hypothetical protein [Acinetobacter baumannii]
LNRSFKNNLLFVVLSYKYLPTEPNAKKLIKDFPESYYSKITNIVTGHSLYIAVAKHNVARSKEIAFLTTYDLNDDQLSQTERLNHIGSNFNLVIQEHIDFLKKEHLEPQNEIEKNLSEGLIKDGGMYIKGATYEKALMFLKLEAWEQLYTYSVMKNNL